MLKHNSESPKLQLKLRPWKHKSVLKLMPKSLKSLKSISTMTHGNSSTFSKSLRNLELMHGPDLQKEDQKLRNCTNRKAKNLKLPLSRFNGILTLRVTPLLNRCGLLQAHKLPRLLNGPHLSRTIWITTHLNLKATWPNSWRPPAQPSSTGLSRNRNSKDILSLSTELRTSIETVNKLLFIELFYLTPVQWFKFILILL